uniref:Uncharacterized protein n=1 Tax=Panagrolaimus davidi TaxID=227884 RepID=A0A914P101_9BILA
MLPKLIQTSRIGFSQSARFSAVAAVNKSFSTSSGQQLKTLSVNVQDGIAVVKLDVPNAKENSFTQDVANNFRKVVDQIQQDDNIKGVVVMSGKPNSFIAGADIKLIDTFKTADEAEKYVRDGQILLEKLEKSSKPVVAAIMETCMGGGLDLGLACNFRIKEKEAYLFYVEVLLGLLPAGCRTLRLPNLISLTTAWDMILTGKTIKPKKAKSNGLFDRVVEPLGPGLLPADINTHEYLEKIAGSSYFNRQQAIYTVERFIKEAYDYLHSEPPNLTQSAEKGWLGCSLALKKVMAELSINVSSDRALKILAVTVASCAKDVDTGVKLNNGFRDGELLHRFSYGNYGFDPNDFELILESAVYFMKNVENIDKKELQTKLLDLYPQLGDISCNS